MLPVRELHFPLPAVAGALVSWWRRCRPGRIAGGMLAGAVVFAMDGVLVLAYGLILNRFWESPSVWPGFFIEHLVFVIASGVIGSLLGLAGASACVVLGSLLAWAIEPRERQEFL